MLPLDSIFVTDRILSPLPHVVFRWRDIDWFVFQRYPQFSNNFTSRTESGPGVAFESEGFRQKSALLSTAFAGVLRTVARAVLQRLASAGLDRLSTSKWVSISCLMKNKARTPMREPAQTTKSSGIV